MHCPVCGKDNPDGNATCFSCGAALDASANAQDVQNAPTVVEETVVIAAAPAEAAQAAPADGPSQAASAAQPYAVGTQQTAASQPNAATQTTPGTNAGAQPASDAQPYASAQQPYTPQQPYGVPPTPSPAAAPQPAPVYKQGCVSAAWSDIKNSEGWFSKVLLLGLVNIVPILNWFVPGYCMRWARQLPLGQIQPMPKSVFVNRGFVNGAFWFVIALVFGLVGGIVSSILGFIPVLGWIAGIAVAIFLEMFMNVALMRTAVADRLGAGFDISSIWQAFKKAPGSLFCISFVPGIIIGICVFVIALIVVGIAMISVGGDIMNLIYMSDAYSTMGHHYGAYDYDFGYAYGPAAVTAVLGILGAMLPAFIILYLIGCFAQAFQYVLVFRAMGHWTARNASDWTSDPTVQATMNLYPDVTPPLQQ